MSEPTDAERLIREARQLAKDPERDNEFHAEGVTLSELADALEASLARERVAVEALELAKNRAIAGMEGATSKQFEVIIEECEQAIATLSAPTGDKVK